MLSCLGVTDQVIPSDPKNIPLTFRVEGFQAVGIIRGK